MAGKRAEALIRKGQRAWTAIKGTAAEQRFWWLDVGHALIEGKNKANRKEGQKFSEWVQEMFPGLHERAASAAMKWAEESETISEIPDDLTHPVAILAWHREQQATQALPEPLQQIAPTSTPKLTQRDAERVAKTIQRASSNDEGAETAQRHVAGLAKKHGLTVPELTEAAKAGAPDTYFRFAPQLQLQLDEFRDGLRVSIGQMEDAGITTDAIKAIFIHFANSL